MAAQDYSSSSIEGRNQPWQREDNCKTWDPGIENIVLDRYLSEIIVGATVASAIDEDDMEIEDDQFPRTDLDSHANMCVAGKNAVILRDTGKKADVSPFTPDYDALSKVPIVDAAVLYTDRFTGEEYALVMHNALHVPAMINNLIPPFIMREAGLIVNTLPKCQAQGQGIEPTEDHHSIYFKNDKLRIPLDLWGIFSYFATELPTEEQLIECSNKDKVLLLTPEGPWNPHSNVYAKSEESMLDWEGNLNDKEHRERIILSDIDEDFVNVCDMTANISKVEVSAIDRCMEINEEQSDIGLFARQLRQQDAPPKCNEVMPDAVELASLMAAKAEESHFKVSIGATEVAAGPYLVEEGDGNAGQDSNDQKSLDKLYERLFPGDNENTDQHVDVASVLAGTTLPISGEINLDEYFTVGAAHARARKSVDAEHLSKVWRIDLETAKKTLDITSQSCVRTGNPNLTKNYGTNDRMLRYRRIKEFFFMDTFNATRSAGKSSRGHKCCQLFVTDKGFVYVVPMKTQTKVDILGAVKQFAKEVGSPEAIICDAHPSQVSDVVRSFVSEIGSTLRVLEEGTPWANKAELYIGLIKRAVRKDMKEANCPLVFWDYCVERRARINNATARNLFQLHGTNAHTAVFGEEADISNLCQFRFYEWCYYRDHNNGFPLQNEVLGRILGPTKGEGNEMAQWVLKANGNVVPRRTVRPLQVAEMHNETVKTQQQVFDKCIEERHGTPFTPPPSNEDKPYPTEFVEYEDEDEVPRLIPDHEDTVDIRGRLINQQPQYDKIINAEVQLQLDDEIATGKVRRRALGPEGETVGSYDDNPILNSMLYEVEFPDGQVKEYAANVIAENMSAQVDDDGFSTTTLKAIIDYKKDESVAVPKSDKYVITKRGGRRLRRSTVGWKLLVQWGDSTETWISLKDLKESHPVLVAEFAKARGIDDEPAFQWWVPYTIKKRDAIIAAVKVRARKTTHKYGIEIPTSVGHAEKLDAENGNHFWRDALNKEMHNVGIAFQILETGERPPVGWKPVTGHLIFDVKMDFTRKARWVLDGHKTSKPEGSTYAGVVSRESVRIMFTYAALNGLDVCAGDIRNAYLQAPSSQQDYIICGPEFGAENVGKKALITRALYGGKAAGRDFRNHLRACMRHMNFVSCPADPDVWMRPAIKSDNSKTYDYILLYTDDVLAVGEHAEKMLREGIGKYFELKEESIGPPKLYLGGHVRKVVLENGTRCWAFSSSQYVQAAVKNVEEYLRKRGRKLAPSAKTPLRSTYRPELDVSPELKTQDAAYYMSLIGVLRWIVELGRVDVCLETSMMSSHLALPREGHLESVFQIFAYLKKHHNTEMVFDPSDPVIDEDEFEKQDWTSSEFGGYEGREEYPPRMPEPRGQGFVMSAKVDADHAGDTVTRRSRTGFLVYLNSALICWNSKKQTSIESSSFGSEFIAMKQCCEYIRGLRYKLRMMGIPIEGPTRIFGDNKSVLCNTTIPDSTLKKKSQSIAYHFVREGSARDEWRTAYVNTHLNEADLLTKTLPSGEKRKGFCRNLLHHIFDEHAAAA